MNQSFIDTHAHLYLEQFDDDIADTIQRSVEQRVDKVFLPNVDSSTYESMMRVARQFPDNCFPMIGVHPSSVKSDYQTELSFIENHFDDAKFYGIGEAGIDLYWDKTFLKEQIVAFKWQIEFAKQTDLPIIIHSRESFNEIFEVLDEVFDKKLKGIFHCFSGNSEQAQKIINWGFKLGIGGVLTYKNSGLANAIKDIDLKHIVLETDAPFLPPVPKRGMRNESAYIPFISNKLAEIYQTSTENIAQVTTENALEIFGI